jgi:CRP-like cAMP-binding protein
MEISAYYFVSTPFFQSLKKSELTLLKDSLQTKSYKRNKEVVREGTYPKGVYILEKGKIKIYQNTFDGSQQIITIHIEGEMFGYRPVLCDARYPVSASAIEDCRVAFIPKKVFLELLSSSPTLSNVLLRNLSYEFTVWVNMITNLGQRSVKERLFLNLLILTEKYRGIKKWPVEITLSRADLAALTGTSNETLARLIKKLKSERLIATKGRTILINGSVQADRIRKALSAMQV